jgi:hypothetical protein
MTYPRAKQSAAVAAGFPCVNYRFDREKDQTPPT